MIKKSICILIIPLLLFMYTSAQEKTTYGGDTTVYAMIMTSILKISDSIEKDRTDSRLYFRRGCKYFDIEEWKKAESDFNKAISIDSTESSYYYQRGATRHRLQQLSDAYIDFSTAIRLNPTYEWAYLDRGIILSEARSFKESDDDYRYALQLRPNWSNALFCIGVNFDDQDNRDSAAYYYEQAIYYDSLGAYKAYNNLGSLFNKQKKYDLAIQQFDKALQIWNGYTFALTNRAQAKYNKGDKAGACADMLQAINLGRKDKIEVYKRYCE